MESIGRLLSLPLVNGTMQKLHMFSHPRMMELVEGGRVGERDGEVGKRGEGWREKRGGRGNETKMGMVRVWGRSKVYKLTSLSSRPSPFTHSKCMQYTNSWLRTGKAWD